LFVWHCMPSCWWVYAVPQHGRWCCANNCHTTYKLWILLTWSQISPCTRFHGTMSCCEGVEPILAFFQLQNCMQFSGFSLRYQ
jgi:hypothetical protein